MKTTQSATSRKRRKKAFYVATCGREKVSVYRRKTPSGNFAYMIANYANGKRRFDSYSDDREAIKEAGKLARRLSERDVLSASMTREQSLEYASAVQTLKPFGVTLQNAASVLAQVLEVVGDVPSLHSAVKFYAARHRRTTPKRVDSAAEELRSLKEKHGISERYKQDLKNRLKRFSDDFQCNVGDVTTADVQAWLDRQKIGSQSYTGIRTVLHLLFEHCVARNYCVDNPVAAVQRVKVKHGPTQIFHPSELSKLLAAASPEFLPCVVLGAFCGLRSAEIERLEWWPDIDLKSRHIMVGETKTKTASRRIIPLSDNAIEWLRPYSGRTGLVWQGGHDAFYDAQQDTAKAAGFKWKANGLRHSFASYRLAQTQNAAQVAMECGNSQQVIFRHYHELVRPADAVKWFAINPKQADNVVAMKQAVTNLREA